MHLLGRLLAFDPARRCSAEEALTHEYLLSFEAIDTQMGQPAYFTMTDPSLHKHESALHSSCSKQAQMQICLQHSKQHISCHAVPCHAMLCRAVLCCAALQCTVLRSAACWLSAEQTRAVLFHTLMRHMASTASHAAPRCELSLHLRCLLDRAARAALEHRVWAVMLT